jgi:hypothetical protein
MKGVTMFRAGDPRNRDLEGMKGMQKLVDKRKKAKEERLNALREKIVGDIWLR